MGEPRHFGNVVENGAFGHLLDPAFDDEESFRLFEAFLNPDWEGVGPESNLTENTHSLYSSQPSKEGAASHPAPQTPSQPSSASPTLAGQSTGTVRANIETGAPAASSTPPSLVSSTSSDVGAQPPPDIATPPAPSVAADVEVYLDLFSTFSNSAQMLYDFSSDQTTSPLGPASTGQFNYGQIDFGQTMQAPNYPALPGSASWQYPMASTAASSNSWGMVQVPPQQQQPQMWSTPGPRAGHAAMAPAVQQVPMGVSHASAPVMSPPGPAPSTNTVTLTFTDPIVPRGFVANPDNHGRFTHVNGRRVYLNGPEGKKLRTGAI